MDWDQIEEQIALRMDRDAEILALRYDDKDHGVVLWERRDEPMEYIVHRWATQDTAGHPLHEPIIFWSGGYYVDLKRAREDFMDRTPQ